MVYLASARLAAAAGVGKALPLERLSACPPTYIIETSEGNLQAGYLFDTPQTDLQSVTGLNQSLVDAGLCDPGAISIKNNPAHATVPKLIVQSCTYGKTQLPEP